MREIKFRVWTGEIILNAQDEFMLSFGAENPELYVHLSDGEFDDVRVESVMQYTGLKDKNGEEIYEGDILGLHRAGRPDEPIGFVKYDNDLCAFVIDKYNGGWEFLYKEIDNHPTLKTIGNIYETAELLANDNNRK